MSVVGPCEWCGGPQVWTVIRGEIYEACKGGCLPLPLEGLVPPTDSEMDARDAGFDGTLEEGVGRACEGVDAQTSEENYYAQAPEELGFPSEL